MMSRTVRYMSLAIAFVCAATSFSMCPMPLKAAETPGTVCRCNPWEAARQVVRAVADARPPEALEMLAAILGGSQMGPGEGWFHPGQSRYGWAWLVERYDRDADGKLAYAELPSTLGLARRLDRDKDEWVTADDFDWSGQAAFSKQASAPAMWFRMADADHNGKISRGEWDALYTRFAGEKNFLSQVELREMLPLTLPRMPPTSGTNQGPSALTLLIGLATQEVGAFSEGPALNALAPDFTLKTHDEQREISLSQFRGKKPVVLMFGNYTCGPFRTQSGNVDELCKRYADKVEFLAIYVREAHPTGGWRMESNDRVEIVESQPRSMEERLGVAQRCSARLQFHMPLLVDTIDDRVNRLYSGQPARLYLIDRAGRVAYKAGRGPFGLKPGELEQSIIMMLLDDK